MQHELSKPQKKIARTIVGKGLMKDYEKALKEVEATLISWMQDKLDNREAYIKVYEQITSSDHFIARRYDNMKGSTYLRIIAQQLADGLISEEDLEGLEEEHVLTITSWAKIFSEGF